MPCHHSLHLQGVVGDSKGAVAGENSMDSAWMVSVDGAGTAQELQ